MTWELWGLKSRQEPGDEQNKFTHRLSQNAEIAFTAFLSRPAVLVFLKSKP